MAAMLKLDERAGAAGSHLRRGLGVFELTAMGTGVIVGAGIFVIIGTAAAHAGGAIWLPFLLGAIAATCTGLSYSELSSRMPQASAAYAYARHAFGPQTGFIVGWLVLFAYIVSGAAVALGFAGYLASLFDVPPVPAAMALLLLCSLLLLTGVKQSVSIGVLFTVVTVAGLLVVIGVSVPYLGDVAYLEMPLGLGGVFYATTLLFFAYLGFEQVANLGEEAKDPSRSLPTAIVAAIALTTVLYVAVALAAVSVLGWEALAASPAPLADVAAVATGGGLGQFITVIALCATANTVLFVLLAASRIIYGMASSGSLPVWLGTVHPKTMVPWAAVISAAAIAIAFSLLGNLTLVVQLTNFGILAAFVVVNLALIRLRKIPSAPGGHFRVPLNVHGIPLPAILGAGISLFMLAHVGVTVLLLGIAVTLAGGVAYLLLGRQRNGIREP